jgi:hypothetical protein
MYGLEPENGCDDNKLRSRSSQSLRKETYLMKSLGRSATRVVGQSPNLSKESQKYVN